MKCDVYDTAEAVWCPECVAVQDKENAELAEIPIEVRAYVAEFRRILQHVSPSFAKNIFQRAAESMGIDL